MNYTNNCGNCQWFTVITCVTTYTICRSPEFAAIRRWWHAAGTDGPLEEAKAFDLGAVATLGSGQMWVHSHGGTYVHHQMITIINRETSQV